MAKKKKQSVKSTNGLDELFGQRLRALRLGAHMSQEKLGEHLGLTFQQIQKYEKGTNRISLSRLVQIVAVLGGDYNYFLGDQNGEPVKASPVEQFMSTKDGVALIEAMMKLSPKNRRVVIALARSLVSGSVCE